MLRWGPGYIFTLDWLYVDVTREGPDSGVALGTRLHFFTLDWLYVDVTR